MKLRTLIISTLLSFFILSALLSAGQDAAEYARTIELADKYFEAGDYINAKASYQIATRLAPDETYPRERLQESIELIKSQMQKSQEYAQKTMLADDLLRDGDLEGARKVYAQAQEILPSDNYAKEKIKEIDNILDERRRIEEGYSASISLADQLFAEEKYNQAIESYKAALEFKPDEKYPAEKIAGIRDILASMEANLSEYESALNLAEQFASRKVYDKAIDQLNIAIKLKPDEQYPRERLKDIVAAKETYEKYTSRVDQADALYISKEFGKAREVYELILKDYPDDSYVQNQVARIEVALEEIDEVNQSQYEVAISRGDAFFSGEDYDKAIEQYQKALAFKPGAEYARSRIEEINQVVSLRKSQDEAYKQTISKGDKLFEEDKYEEAREEFVKARELKPLEQYPEVKIGEIDNILEALKNEKQSYDALIAGADKLFYSDEYLESREQYKRALQIFPDKQYPKDQITMINEILGLKEQYTKELTTANMLLEEQKFREALVAFIRASEIDPKQKYPLDKISEIETLLAGQAEAERKLEERYNQLLYEGDKAMAAGNYEEAISLYQQAADLKPGEELPREEIALAEQKVFEVNQAEAINIEYDRLIALADKQFTEGDYLPARDNYSLASELKPAEPYPPLKIEEIDRILADLAAAEALREQYDRLISGADELFASELFSDALPKYQAALDLKPGEAYPAERIAEINGILDEMATQALLDKQYDDLVSLADQMFESESYNEALEKYQSALELKPGETYPSGRIDEINRILQELARLAELDKEYNDIISRADQLFAGEAYADAIAEYQAALNVKPGESYPADKIAEINSLLDAKERLEALENQYNGLISDADKLFGEEAYTDALNLYQNALNIKPGEPYPAERIAEINTLLEDIALREALEKQYADLIEEADGLFDQESYSGALPKYQSALALKPGEPHPAKRIEEINGLLDELARQAALEKQYGDLIAEADQLFDNQSYGDALLKYQSALGVKPGEAYPTGKVNEINGILGEIARMEAIEEEYEETIAEADRLFGEEDFGNALTKYREALSLKPDESYPAEKIDGINGLLDEMARLEALEKQYGELIAAADKYFDEKSYEQARGNYQSALELKPGEAHPADRITEINGILDEIARIEALDKEYSDLIASADRLFDAGTYAGALPLYQSALELKPGEPHPANRIGEINSLLDEIARKAALDKQYSDLINEADQFFSVKNYSEALSKYNSALGLKPDEEYPSGRIAEIDEILEEFARLEALDRQYEGLIAEGDKLFENESYSDALAKYQSAMELKPQEAYPSERISEINGIIRELARLEAIDKEYNEIIERADRRFGNKSYEEALADYQAALALKPQETYPSERIDEINQILDAFAAQKQLEENYARAISAGDEAFKSQSYDSALVAYQEALNLKPDEFYPAEKVKAINAILEEVRRKEELDSRYNELIAQADEQFSAGSYQESLINYGGASDLKPEETYPREKITEIDDILARLAREAEVQRQYDEAITFADKHLEARDYKNALLEYKKANSIKPTEDYPLDQIDAIEKKIAEEERARKLNADYAAAIEAADGSYAGKDFQSALVSYQQALNLKPEESYPQQRINEIRSRLEQLAQERDEAYAMAITKADNYFELNDYEMAKMNYESASQIKPDETYPIDRLKEVNELLLRQRELLREEYDKAIADADKFYAAKIYDNAIESYRQAAMILADETYPVEMIRKILKLISERAIVDINREPLLIKSNTTERFAFRPVPVQNRKANYIFFKARNMSDTEYKVIISFGQDGAKNGGVVIKVPAGDQQNDFLVRISAQYKWFSEDNNWITMYPEGGDFEVGLVQISNSE